jgi:BlaI family transcriptional regulator, penicillinase repressor
MARKPNTHPFTRPSDSELDILSILWEEGPATVRQVHDTLTCSKPSQYTTTLKLMQIMVDKGLLERQDVDRAHVYRPRIPKKLTQRRMAKHLLTRAFGGSVHSLLVGALGAKTASSDELDALSEIIDQQRKKGRK